jgi:hypothetical protein
MRFTDALNLHLSNRMNLQIRYQIEKEDDGTFIKHLFAQQVSRELFSQFADIIFAYTRVDGLQLAAGLNWFFRKEWILYPKRRVARDYRAFSPRLIIFYRLGPRLMLHLSFSPKTYRDINLEKQYYSTGKVNLKYYF